MPRSARLDAPGVLHHVIIRGIERRKIFLDDEDRQDLVDPLALLVPKTDTLVVDISTFFALLNGRRIKHE